MELNEAIETLEGLIEPQSYTLGGYDKEALRIVLTELGRLTQENKELKQKINDFVEEMRCME